MRMLPHPTTADARFKDWPLAAKSILGFWLFYTLTVVARAFLGTDPWAALENRLLLIATGVVVNGLIYVSIVLFARRSAIRRKAVIAALASLLGSLVMGLALVTIEDRFQDKSEEMRFQAREGFTV